ncbi:DUF6221 family protein [Streptomyces rochei]|uniref:DUF6221 family protein n=1 Tax=Streptomyces rochei TaxID=1928 RepID=UPI0036799170
MTAQGGDLLAWLDRAISERERWATVAAVSPMGVPEGGAWQQRRDEHRGGYRIFRPDPEATPESVAFVFGESAAMHITLNDPDSVLRRCAADRKLLELHGDRCHSCPAKSATGYLDEWTQFDYGDVCPVVELLADSYGWTEGER